MKIKRFNENSQNIPQVGDYVLMTIAISRGQYKSEEIMNYVNSTIGQISNIRNVENGNIVYYPDRDISVTYEKVPNQIKSWFGYYKNIKKYFRTLPENQIVVFGQTKEEVELKLRAKKYNL